MIINEADIEKDYVGHIEIYDDVCTVDLPADMPKELLKQLGDAYICGKKSEIDVVEKGRMVDISPPGGGKRRGGEGRSSSRGRDNEGGFKGRSDRGKPRGRSDGKKFGGKKKPVGDRNRSRRKPKS